MIKLTGICHFYNEEYLLPYWLKHHKGIFDHAIMIDYNSTDNSRKIIEEICPEWTLVNTVNKDFSAKSCDGEVLEYEKTVDGYKIALNVTEFLIGNIKKLIYDNRPITEIYNRPVTEQHLLPVYPMIDNKENEFMPLVMGGLVRQRYHGIDFTAGNNFIIRRARSLHNNIDGYPTGRHFHKYTTTECFICWYGFSPFNEQLIQRKLQIQNNIPQSDKDNQFGVEHLVNREQLIGIFKQYQSMAVSLSDIILPKLDEMQIR